MLMWAQLALVALLALAYLRRTIALRGALEPVAAARILCFAAGVLTIAIAVVVLQKPASELLYMHTTEHLLIADLATLMLAFGLTGSMLRATGAERPPAWLRVLAWPPIAVSLWALDFVVWMWPPVYEAVLLHGWLHLVSHVLLVGLGVNMWISLIGLTGSRFGLRSRIAGILTTRLIGAGLGLAAIWVSSIFYPADLYEEIARAISPLADQGIAGAIMLGEMALVAICMLIWAHMRLDSAEAQTRAAGAPPAAFEPPLPAEVR